MENRSRRIGLVGNPNTGKSSIFNHLTGLKQHIGNFPGVTVERKAGQWELPNGESVEIIDLPGTYSIVPQSEDERVVYDLLASKDHPEHPTELICVVDASNLERNLLLFTQLYDMLWPLTVVLTMPEFIAESDLKANVKVLSDRFSDVAFIVVNARTGHSLDKLANQMLSPAKVESRSSFGQLAIEHLASNNVLQQRDATARFRAISKLIQPKTAKASKEDSTARLDRFLVHPILGYAVLIGLLMVIFQVVFHIASYPMDWIDGFFAYGSEFIKSSLPSGVFTDLLAEGIVPGIGGVVVFVPQIAFLFFFLSLLEESGYMSRIVFMTDRMVRPFGLSGRSVVPMISSAACAIPGVMGARSIPNFRDKLITIFVAPLMSCSARIPVYTLLIALVIPDTYWGPFKLQGLVLFSMYALGLFTALGVAIVLKFIIKSDDPNFLLMELPRYQVPRWSQVGLSIWTKVKVFVIDAGKVILAISILLWVLASYGPGDRMENAVKQLQQEQSGLSEEELGRAEANARLENSYIGILGKGIEPVIEPLGYDWKIGISLITSFAAREVFVGSMATIYSVGDEDAETGLIEKMKSERTQVGLPRYSLATGISLMVFYAYAMQCMATLAVVRRETNSWKWPLIQTLAMGILAYIGALIAFQIFQ
jgi:ferrous iron transport protein B